MELGAGVIPALYRRPVLPVLRRYRETRPPAATRMPRSGSMRGTASTSTQSDIAAGALEERLSTSDITRTMCLWCDGAFRARNNGGSQQRFCCPAHRTAYHSAARRYVKAMVAAGKVSVDELKAAGTACTLAGTRSTP